MYRNQLAIYDLQFYLLWQKIKTPPRTPKKIVLERADNYSYLIYLKQEWIFLKKGISKGPFAPLCWHIELIGF